MRKVSGTKDSQLQLRWRDDFDYFIDVFDEGFFDNEVNELLCTHGIYLNTRSKERFPVNCKVTIKGKKAVIDYIGMNDGSDIKEGVLNIIFSDKYRNFVKRVDWLEKSNKKAVEKDVAETNWKIPDDVLEGKRILAEVQYFSRNITLMNKLKAEKKYTCEACGYRLKVNGVFIVDCHHKNPVSMEGERKSNPDDLLVLCPSCHRIAHTSNPPLSLVEIQAALRKPGNCPGGVIPVKVRKKKA